MNPSDVLEKEFADKLIGFFGYHQVVDEMRSPNDFD